MRIASLTMQALETVAFSRDRISHLLLALLAFLAAAVACDNQQALAAPQRSSGNSQSRDVPQGVSSREAKEQAIRVIPFSRLSSKSGKEIKSVVEKPSFYRRMPTQQIECDPQLFKFLVRRPEVMVNIWELMGITKVAAERVSPYSFYANDGVGTTCRCDLVYGDNNIHIYYGNGAYDGSMTPRKVKGRCVCILRSSAVNAATGKNVVSGTMDVFLKLDNLGADLLTKTIGPFVGKTADHNFVETASFISQISQVCEQSPSSAYGLAMSLNKVDANVRREFAALATNIAQTSQSAAPGKRLEAASAGTTSQTGDTKLRGSQPVHAHLQDTREYESVQPVARSKVNAPSPKPVATIMRFDSVSRVPSETLSAQSSGKDDFVSRSTVADFDAWETPQIAPKKANLFMRR